MMLYTSYETSVALRAAGAPQEIPAGGGYWRDFGDAQHYVSRERRAASCFIRSMRLDEILEALAKATWQADRGVRVDSPSGCVDEWVVAIEATTSRRRVRYASGEDRSPVEAAAACWLAVLRAAREAAK